MIGVNLIRRLIGDGFQVFLLTRPGGNRTRLKCVAKSVQILRGDITDDKSVLAAVEKARPNIVFHLASTPFNPPTIESSAHIEVNVLGTLHLLEALQSVPDAKVIFTGSAAAYGNGSHLREEERLLPGTMLGASKACASILLQAFSKMRPLHTVELRLFTPFGPWENPGRLIPNLILSALAGRDIPMTQGDQRRDFVYVGDVVDALELCATQPLPSGSVVNIGSGVGTSVREVANLVMELMGHPVKLMVGELPTRPDEIMEMSADITLAREILGWQPRSSLQDGLRKSITWFTEHRESALDLQR